MKKILYLVFLSIVASCSLFRQHSSPEEQGEFIILRKYIGDFIDYRYTNPEEIADPNIIWIKTTLENVYGKISAYGKKCEFIPGERLYVKRTIYNPGIGSGYWVYFIENDSDVSYEATEFQYDRKISVEKIFQTGFENQ